MTVQTPDELWLDLFDVEWGFGIFDAFGRLKSHTPGLRALLLDPGDNSLLDHGIIQDIFPELIGQGQALEELRHNPETTFQLEKIFRPSLHGAAGYVSLRVKAYDDGWLVAVQNTTLAAISEQTLMQQRNELDLLSTELAATKARMDKLLRTFVPSVVVDDLLNKGDIRPGGERRLVTILFVDLRSFTSWVEKQHPEEAIAALNRLLALAFDILNDHGATMNQFLGDGFISIFNAPIEQPCHAALAVESARQIVSLPGLGDTVRFGAGINTGFAMVGNVGSERAMNYSAIGTTANLASRIQQLAGPGEVLFGEGTRELMGDQFSHTLYGNFKVKGISRQIAVYKLLD